MGTVSNMVAVNGAATKIGFSKTENRVFKGNKYISEYVRISHGTEYEIELDALVDSGQISLGNNSAVATLQVGFATGVYPIEIPPGGMAFMPLAVATDTIYCLSDTADSTIGAFTADTTDEISVGSSHGLTVGRIVRFTTTDALPAGLSEDTDYFVVMAAPTYVKVSAYPNGDAITTTDAGTGTHTCTQVFPCYTTILANQA